MSQYKDGTVTVTNGDATVTGSGTQFEDNVTAGDLFKIQGENVLYTVASITDDTHLELAANYAGVTGGSKSYLICTDFTPNFDIPEVNGGDLDWPTVLTNALRLIDTTLKDHEDRIAALE